MDAAEREIAEMKFELKVHKSNGQAYEDFFVDIMTRRYPAFKPIKPQGKLGDKKNDGYDKSTGKYYQVYSPEKPSESIAKAIKKARADFTGLYKY
ncbi:MAG: hypothetical protein WCO77_11460 [bacterium]